MPIKTDTTTLEMALVGYEAERAKIEAKIREIQGLLKGKKVHIAASTGMARKNGTRNMSAAGRARIAAAQKKRWAEFHKRQAAV